ncbi:MAG: DHA2 family efflux MFS transporter permease subunit [Hydrogenophaga sp.]|jgi:DHA2 family multidrug resistance protein|uniref:DHA2 family efflux MFS transporter permease subunit n=1 Tax=Hydrogenophaga sp. TaxID=1904254 RepID=UPI002611784E|nr:DHA2 family efflux MFS transporter permease subunit [Hydrogenophaga sp.]MCW5672095.1 DHA2 family efflux MFS transporter permease subunit [Hydrogenophaga sp.]
MADSHALPASGAVPSGATPPAPAPSASPTVFEPLKGAQLVLGTVALSLATFMNVLDTSIANVSIPAIAGDMGVSPAQGTWVITSFAVANAISVPLTGWLTQRFGQVRLFTMSVLLFVIASWLCGLAPNIGMLIAFRVLQGLVAGPMIPLSQTLLLASYPRAKAGTAMAMWAMTVLVAPVAGPLLGGWITDNISWPWIFYINIPVGLLAAALTWSIYRSRDPGPRRVPLDVIGLVLLVLFVGAMQIMIDMGKELDWFESGEIIALAVVAVVSFLFFLAWELTDKHPIVEIRLFARRNFVTGTLALSIAYGLFFGNVVLLPLWLQQHMGYTATWAGLATAPVGLLAIVLSPWVGKNVSRIDPRKLATVAFLGFGAVLWMRSHFNTQADFMTILIPTLLQGAAMAFFFIPLQAIVFSGLQPQQTPSAAGLSNFVRITAGAVGTSLFTTLWESRASLHHAQLVESIHSGNATAMATLDQLMGSGMNREQALTTIDRMINQQAFTLAVTDLFYLSAALFFLLVAVIWFSKPVLGAAVDAGGGH